MTKYHVVTSFSDKLWKNYASNTVPSVRKHLPKEVTMSAWYNGDYSSVWEEELPDVRFEDLNAVGDYQYFRQKYKRTKVPKVEPGHQFRFNFLPFWNKVCALYQEIGKHTEGYVVWVDADVVSIKEITMDDLERWTDGADVSTLVRGAPWNTWDTGFVALKVPEAIPLVKEVYDLYTSGRIFDHNEWHDAYLFTVAFKDFKDKLRLKNLNMMSSAAHPFDASTLPPQLAHLKGAERKMKGFFMDPSKLNGIFKADFTGVKNVQDDPEIRLTDSGNIVMPDGTMRNTL